MIFNEIKCNHPCSKEVEVQVLVNFKFNHHRTEIINLLSILFFINFQRNFILLRPKNVTTNLWHEFSNWIIHIRIYSLFFQSGQNTLIPDIHQVVDRYVVSKLLYRLILLRLSEILNHLLHKLAIFGSQVKQKVIFVCLDINLWSLTGENGFKLFCGGLDGSRLIG